jgi:endonuclease YncB( thermonuclease family)
LSLNHKRRIFRPSAFAVPSLPSPAVVLAALGAFVTIGAGAWMALRPLEAPAQPPVIARLAADPSQIAVVDGGTFRVKDNVVRLDGIAPPPRGETCHRPNGSAEDCGVAAANMLAALVRAASTVECRIHGTDAMGRSLAVCDGHGTDFNAALVLAGWARADGDHAALRRAEDQARAERRGIWGG